MLHIPRLSDVSHFCGRDGDRMSLSELATFLELVMAVEPEVSKGSSRVRVQGMGEHDEPIQKLLYMENVLPVELVPHAITVAQLLTGDLAELAASLQRDVLSSDWQVDDLQLVQEAYGAKWSGSISLVGQPTGSGKANTHVESGYSSKALCRLALICKALKEYPSAAPLPAIQTFRAALQKREGYSPIDVSNNLPSLCTPIRSWVIEVLWEESFDRAVAFQAQVLGKDWEMQLGQVKSSGQWICKQDCLAPPFGRRVKSVECPDAWKAILLATVEAYLLELRQPSEVAVKREA